MENETKYRVCRGRFLVNDEVVPVSPQVLKIALVSGGVDQEDPCMPLAEPVARRILYLERQRLLAGLVQELKAHGLDGRAA